MLLIRKQYRNILYISSKTLNLSIAESTQTTKHYKNRYLATARDMIPCLEHLIWIGTYRTCSHWQKCLVTACCWLALAVSSFSVYILTGKDKFQVVRTRWPGGIVGPSDPRGSWFDSHSCKSGFFQPSGRHVRSFCFFRMILVRLASELLNRVLH